MRILILGATGGIGSAVCRLSKGHALVALARSPEKVPAGVEAIAGDPLRGDEVARIACDAAIFTLGPRPGSDVLVQEAGIRALLQAPVARIAVISAALLYNGIAPTIGRLFLGKHVADLRAMEALVTASDKDWTILRPPRLTDKPGRGSYRTALDRMAGYTITREDTARALLDVIEQHTFSRQIVGIAAP